MGYGGVMHCGQYMVPQPMAHAARPHTRQPTAGREAARHARRDLATMTTNALRQGKNLPVLPPRTPAEYIAGQQEANVVLTSLSDMLTWAQNYARSRSIWPLGYGLACCAIEMMAAAQSHYDLARFGSEVFRSSPRQADLMIVAGTVCTQMGPRLVRLWDHMPDPKCALSMGHCATTAA